MTTAHRPTWKAAVGRSEEGGWSSGGARSAAVSALDAPAHTSLKFRSQLEDKKAVIQKSLLELEQAERRRNHLPRRPLDANVEERARLKLLAHSAAEVDDAAIKSKYDDSDVDRGGASDDDDDDDSKSKSDESDLDGSDDDNESSDGSDDDDDEDEEALLQAELAKIRAEREEAQKKSQDEHDRDEQAKQEEAALLGNPLLNPGGGGAASSSSSGGPARSGVGASSSNAKRRWNDDVVFRNQARGEPAPKKRFINDTVRNDFHKRFLNKFIR